jgi:hypothetical protein
MSRTIQRMNFRFLDGVFNPIEDGAPFMMQEIHDGIKIESSWRECWTISMRG